MRKGKAEHCSAFGRGYLGHDIVIGKIYLIIMGHGSLALVRKPTCTCSLIERWLADNRHKGELTVVVYPGTWLVCLFETVNTVRSVCILPSVAHSGSTGCPEVHAPWQCNGRIGVSCREFECRLCSHKRIHILYKILLCIHD